MIRQFGKENALLLIDVQKGVDVLQHWGGPTGRRNNPDAESHMLRLLAGFREKGLHVAYTRHDSREANSPLKFSLPTGDQKPGFEIQPGDIVVEKDVKAASVCRENYDLISRDTSGTFSVLRMSVDSYLDLDASKLPSCDVVYLDPPYEFANDVIEKILSKICNRGLLRTDAVVIVERSSRTAPFTWPAGLAALKERKYGEGAVYFGVS